jgi:cytochrome P450
VTLAGLEHDFHGTAAAWRATAPVLWVDELGAWVATTRDTVLRMLRDPETFTVDDPRFATARVLGPSMLSLDGTEHTRHREPFAHAFGRQAVDREQHEPVAALAHGRVAMVAPSGRAEWRREVAGPLAVDVMAHTLALTERDPGIVLGWYDAIVAAVTAATDSTATTADDSTAAAIGALGACVDATRSAGHGVVPAAAAALSRDELVANVGVMLFGGIETAEAMTTNALFHLLTSGTWPEVVARPGMVDAAIEESLRLEPAAARVDRYATRDTVVAGARLRRGDFVILSLAAANRDPAVFADPDRFDLHRPNAGQHLTFVRGAHACVGMHLARLETASALRAAIELMPELRLDPAHPPPRVSGTIFRKPPTLPVLWRRPP